jgi:hypothetical protein
MNMSNYQWLRASAQYHYMRNDPRMAQRFDACADELRDAHVARIVAENPGIDVAEVRASYDRTNGPILDRGLEA